MILTQLEDNVTLIQTTPFFNAFIQKLNFESTTKQLQ